MIPLEHENVNTVGRCIAVYIHKNGMKAWYTRYSKTQFSNILTWKTGSNIVIHGVEKWSWRTNECVVWGDRDVPIADWLGLVELAPPGKDKIPFPYQKSFHAWTTPRNRGVENVGSLLCSILTVHICRMEIRLRMYIQQYVLRILKNSKNQVEKWNRMDVSAFHTVPNLDLRVFVFLVSCLFCRQNSTGHLPPPVLRALMRTPDRIWSPPWVVTILTFRTAVNRRLLCAGGIPSSLTSEVYLYVRVSYSKVFKYSRTTTTFFFLSFVDSTCFFLSLSSSSSSCFSLFRFTCSFF